MQRFSSLFIVFLCSFSLLVSCISRNVEKNSNRPFKSNGKVVLQTPLTTSYVMTQKYRPLSNPSHQGVDLAGSKNSPIFTAAPGRVVYVGRKFSGYGKMILIDHGGGVSTLYSHLNKFYVNSGQHVHGRQIIGAMGRTGRATGVHLHFEVMINKLPVDPELYINL